MFGKKFWPLCISTFVGVFVYQALMGILGNIAPWWQTQVLEILSLAFIVVLSTVVAKKFFPQMACTYSGNKSTSSEMLSTSSEKKV